MSEHPSLSDLIRQVHAGDEAAAAELVRWYEPAIRRTVWSRLPQGRLRGLLEMEDVCQVVWTDFFARLMAGKFELGRPGQLLRLLSVMARNHLAKEARKLCTIRRGGGERRLGHLPAGGCVDPSPDPSQQLLGEELRQRAHKLLSAEEWRLAEDRAGGRTWAEIAAARGGRADALRMRLARARQRVTEKLA